MNSKKIVLIVIACTMILVVAGNLTIPKIWQIFYPLHYKEEVYKVAEQYELDPYLLFSIIKVESKFNNRAVSEKGALGLMQIMPTTGAWAAENISYESFDYDDLYDPKVNIKIGAWYLKYLLSEFNNNLIITLAAYNAGQGNVKRWLSTEIWNGSSDKIDNIPFYETKAYVDRVLTNYQRYKNIYKP